MYHTKAKGLWWGADHWLQMQFSFYLNYGGEIWNNNNEVMNEVIQTKFQLIQFMWTPSQVGTTTRKVFHTWIAMLTSYDAETRWTKVNIGLVLNFHQSLAPDSSSYVSFASFTFKC